MEFSVLFWVVIPMIFGYTLGTVLGKARYKKLKLGDFIIDDAVIDDQNYYISTESTNLKKLPDKGYVTLEVKRPVRQ